MRFRCVSRRGQATVELALAAPFVVGLLAVTLQGGLILSDQLNLEHYVYEGAQWALANPNAPDTGAGSVQEHIYKQMCGGASVSPSPAGSRFCTAESGGIPNLAVTVSARNTPVTLARTRPAQAVMAATSCKNWHLDVAWSAASPAQIGPNTTRYFTVTYRVQAGDPNPTDPTPVTLSASDYPPGLANGTPYFEPPTVYNDGDQARLTIRTGTNTVPGTYPVFITGQDQCGGGPTPTPAINPLMVIAGGSFNPPPVPVAVTVDPVQVGICAGTLTSVHVTGSGNTGFKAGATVKFGSAPGVGVAIVDGGPIDATVTLPSGVYDITVTNPDTSTGTAAGGLTVLPNAPCPPPDPLPPTRNCSGNTAGSFQTLIDITWNEPLALPLLTTNTPPFINLDASQRVLCQS